MDRKKEHLALRGTWRSTENARLLKSFIGFRDDVLQRMLLFEKYFGFFVSFYPTLHECATIFTDTVDQKNFFHQFGLYESRYMVSDPGSVDEVCEKVSSLLDTVLCMEDTTEQAMRIRLMLKGELRP